MTVLDYPRVDETTLDETVVFSEARCQSALGCDSGAEWSCVMRCCGSSASLCTRCLIRSKAAVTPNHSITCMMCHTHLGIVTYDEIVRVSPI